MTEITETSTITKTELLKRGLGILNSKGRTHLKISTLCTELNLTKGSFYHWFNSKSDYDQQMLSLWRELFTRRFIEEADLGNSTKEKLQRLIQNCIENVKKESRLEVEINMWANQDSEIKKFVESVYKERFKYLLDLLEEIYQDSVEAKRHSLILYSLIIGVDLFFKKLSKKELELIFKDYLD